jgi:DNA-binding transcriptional LysR family regulator
MIEAGETEVARDELVWLLSECPDFLDAHLHLGLIALEEEDPKLARGHFGRAYELCIRALEAAGIAFRASFTSPSLAGQMAALRAGLGVGVLPAAMATRDLTVLREPLPPLSDSEIALVSTRAMGGPAELLSHEVLRALERGPLAS